MHKAIEDALQFYNVFNIVKFLIEKGAKVEEETFDYAMYTGNLDIIKLLLDSGVLGNPIPDNLRQIYANKKTNNKKQKDQIQKLIMNYGK